MHSLGLVALGFLLLVAQSTFSMWLPLGQYTPNCLLPIVVALGMSNTVSLAKGGAISFALGYLLDSACGLPLGLQTLTMVSSFVIARNAGARLFPKGALSQVLLTALTALISGAILLSLRAIFEAPAAFEVDNGIDRALGLLGYALLSGACSPVVTRCQRAVERLLLRHSEARSQLGA